MSILSAMSSLSIDKIVFVGLPLCSAVFLLVRAFYQAYATPLRDVPGPWLAKFSRLWQLYAVWSRKFEKTNVQLHRKYGPIVRIGPNEYSVDDPEAAKAIYRPRNQLTKSARYSAWAAPGQELNLFAESDIVRHEERRREVASMYQMSAVLGMEKLVDRITTTFCKRMETFAQSQQDIDMTEWLHFYAFDVIGDIAFGKDFGLVDKGRDIFGIMDAVHAFSRYGALVGVYSEWHALIIRLTTMLTTTKKEPQGLAYIVEFGKQLIADRIQQGESAKSRGDFTSLLYEMHLQDPAAFSIDDMLFHTIPNIGGGSDTTAITLSAALYFLCHNPVVLRKLREELDEKFKDKRSDVMISFKEAQECLYLQAVIKETMRMHPVTGLPLPRMVPKEGMVLGGRFFPGNSIVGVNPYVAHTNKDVFGSDAESFRPERWLEGPKTSAKMEQYFFTFGRGPRTCLGKNVSLMELSKLIPEIVLRFDIALVDPSREWHVYNDWLMLQKGFQVRISERMASA